MVVERARDKEVKKSDRDSDRERERVRIVRSGERSSNVFQRILFSVYSTGFVLLCLLGPAPSASRDRPTETGPIETPPGSAPCPG